VNYGISSATGDDPLHILVAVVYLLVFGVGGNERKVAGSQFVPFRAVRSRDDCTEATSSVDNSVYNE
jgi:hypothetical protein